ncbi:MAG: hypothetical protein ACOC2W_02780 [bacterium]
MIVTGTSTSRLAELKKFKITDDFTNKYQPNGSINNDGVDYQNSTEDEEIVYYISGVKYVDDLDTGITTFEFETVDIDNNSDFIDRQIIKDSNKSGIVSRPKIISDVFIDRQQQSIFDKNYRLEFINNLGELTTYIGGRYYNIKNNS